MIDTTQMGRRLGALLGMIGLFGCAAPAETAADTNDDATVDEAAPVMRRPPGHHRASYAKALGKHHGTRGPAAWPGASPRPQDP